MTELLAVAILLTGVIKLLDDVTPFCLPLNKFVDWCDTMLLTDVTQLLTDVTPCS